jgi:hypothetical protein
MTGAFGPVAAGTGKLYWLGKTSKKLGSMKSGKERKWQALEVPFGKGNSLNPALCASKIQPISCDFFFFCLPLCFQKKKNPQREGNFLWGRGGNLREF